ncbi:aminotransferase-like domain-containing protein [Streptomyces purpurogeneiscleroticus]|uniref:aminotransferase-like domain-containing protein n=1 Tax=Streptomyces purpurogeneiscleroticus TaxID=68259 RepID=UPI001CC04DDD|nr:PLP-dependent aminotransferase family protein [Streptomyces purpurogeneiscleroticus]MBZ4016965.1 GntR family transcriptional regulator [Streptomyces purpurogeneiscleroticus]
MAGTDDYLRIADAVAADIAAGRLRPGDRLATQRGFARTHGIANSTAHRVYRELARRGLTVGEVGRGTFVRAAQHAPGPALAEPAAPDAGTRVNLELNYPVVPEQAALLAEGMAPLLRPDALDAALRPVGPAGHPAAREAAAALLARTGFAPGPGRVLFAGNGRHAVAGAVAALVPPGGRLGVEAATYPLVKAIAARIGVTLVPLAMDAHGLRPEAVRAAHRSAPLHAVYLQPTLHNPLGTTMPAPRRVELSDTLRELDLWAVEDAIWSFLCEETDLYEEPDLYEETGLPPLAALAPERTVLVDSLSKRLAPGLTVGLVLPPAARREAVASALRSGGWTATGFALEAVTRWLADGTVDRIVRAKRRDAADRQALVRRHLEGFAVSADPRSYFAWWELPEGWRAESFLAAAARRGIAVTPGTAFAVAPEGAQGAAPAPHAVRIALAGAPPELLPYALSTLAAVARGTPEDAFPE